MLGLYIHLPFCRVHCAYCPFVVSTDDAMQDAYVEALVREITTRGGGEEVDTIYFGGGTPSRTPPEHRSDPGPAESKRRFFSRLARRSDRQRRRSSLGLHARSRRRHRAEEASGERRRCAAA